MLSLRNICWSAPDGKQVLRNINLDIESGEFAAITGPNGGGKTTLARIIAGIEKPESGTIIYNGEDITELDVTERARKGISFAFQQPVRFKGITVRQLLEVAAGKSLARDSLCQILGSVGLGAEEYLDRDIDSTLSGGEIKRIEIATVLARHTGLSVFDEPEAGIDLWSFKNLIETFREIHDTSDGTLIIISHQERILKIADEIIMVKEGAIADRGPSEFMLPKMLKQEHDPDTLSQACYRQEEMFNE